jgi:hypothetical protein
MTATCSGRALTLALIELDELRQLLDLLREKQVAHFEYKDLKVRLGGGDEEEEFEAANPEPVREEAPDPHSGLTPTEEKELFYSAE